MHLRAVFRSVAWPTCLPSALARLMELPGIVLGQPNSRVFQCLSFERLFVPGCTESPTCQCGKK